MQVWTAGLLSLVSVVVQISALEVLRTPSLPESGIGQPGHSVPQFSDIELERAILDSHVVSIANTLEKHEFFRGCRGHGDGNSDLVGLLVSERAYDFDFPEFPGFTDESSPGLLTSKRFKSDDNGLSVHSLPISTLHFDSDPDSITTILDQLGKATTQGSFELIFDDLFVNSVDAKITAEIVTHAISTAAPNISTDGLPDLEAPDGIRTAFGTEVRMTTSRAGGHHH